MLRLVQIIGARIAGTVSVRHAGDPLNRRCPGAQLKGFTSRFVENRDRLLAEDLLPAVEAHWQRGADEHEFARLLERTEYSRYDERLVEYSWILWKLLKCTGGTARTWNLLDVGCVLNRPVIAEYVSRMLAMIWLINPAQEPIAYGEHVAYVLADVRNHKLPANLQFDVITCLSTLEHIGMDTRRYGGPGGEVNRYPDEPQKNAIEALQSMYQLLRPGGVMYLSVPYGPFEYVYDYGGTLPIYYIFDEPRLQDLLDCLPREKAATTVEIYKVVPAWGWARTGPNDDRIPRYAVGCAAAGAVALVEVVPS